MLIDDVECCLAAELWTTILYCWLGCQSWSRYHRVNACLSLIRRVHLVRCRRWRRCHKWWPPLTTRRGWSVDWTPCVQTAHCVITLSSLGVWRCTSIALFSLRAVTISAPCWLETCARAASPVSLCRASLALVCRPSLSSSTAGRWKSAWTMSKRY